MRSAASGRPGPVRSASDVAATLAGRRALVTGHTGFKGAWLTRWLHRMGAEVHGLALPASAPSAYHELGIADLVASEVTVDVRDGDAVERAVADVQPEFVFHLAAQALVRSGWTDRRTTYAVNVLGTVHVVEAALRQASTASVVVATTDKVYRNDENGRPFVESDRLGGSDPYSASKAAAELVLEPYRHAHHMGLIQRPVTSVRAGNVIGGGDHAVDRLLPDIVRALGTGSPVTLRRPQAVRPWQFVLDCLWGYVLVASAGDTATLSSAYNFAPTDGERTVLDVASRAAHAFGVDPDTAIVVEAEDDNTEHTLLRLDPGRASAELGWAPLFTVEEAVDLTIESYRADASEKRTIADRQFGLHAERSDRYAAG